MSALRRRPILEVLEDRFLPHGGPAAVLLPEAEDSSHHTEEHSHSDEVEIEIEDRHDNSGPSANSGPSRQSDDDYREDRSGRRDGSERQEDDDDDHQPDDSDDNSGPGNNNNPDDAGDDNSGPGNNTGSDDGLPNPTNDNQNPLSPPLTDDDSEDGSPTAEPSSDDVETAVVNSPVDAVNQEPATAPTGTPRPTSEREPVVVVPVNLSRESSAGDSRDVVRSETTEPLDAVPESPEEPAQPPADELVPALEPQAADVVFMSLDLGSVGTSFTSLFQSLAGDGPLGLPTPGSRSFWFWLGGLTVGAGALATYAVTRHDAAKKRAALQRLLWWKHLPD